MLQSGFVTWEDTEKRLWRQCYSCKFWELGNCWRNWTTSTASFTFLFSQFYHWYLDSTISYLREITSDAVITTKTTWGESGSCRTKTLLGDRYDYGQGQPTNRSKIIWLSCTCRALITLISCRSCKLTTSLWKQKSKYLLFQQSSS